MNSPVLVRYCGQLDISQRLLTSSSNQLYLNFVTNGDTMDLGFLITWTSVEVDLNNDSKFHERLPRLNNLYQVSLTYLACHYLHY